MFAALTPEERAPYVRDGKAATKRWRTAEKWYASTSFGLPRRRTHVRVNAQAPRRVALWSRLRPLPLEVRMRMLADNAISEDTCCQDYLKAVSSARGVARCGAKRQRHEFADGERALSEWHAARTPAAARAFTAALGLPPTRASEIASICVWTLVVVQLKRSTERVQNKNAGGGNFPQQSVGKVFMQFLELRQPTRVLNSGELKKALEREGRGTDCQST